jgi:hypothetical protein
MKTGSRRLARKGENIRDICRQERRLRAELRPPGALGKILFDRLWSSYLCCLLIDRTEAELLSPDQQQSTGSTQLPTLRVDHVPTLVYENVVAPNGVCAEILKYLAITQRYDAYYFNEFYRNLCLLLALRNRGVSGLTDELAAKAMLKLTICIESAQSFSGSHGLRKENVADRSQLRTCVGPCC